MQMAGFPILLGLPPLVGALDSLCIKTLALVEKVGRDSLSLMYGKVGLDR